MKKNEGKLNLKRIGAEGYYGYIHPISIEINNLTRLQVKQLKSPYKNIFYGISTDKLIGYNDPISHLECKTYLNYGNVW